MARPTARERRAAARERNRRRGATKDAAPREKAVDAHAAELRALASRVTRQELTPHELGAALDKLRGLLPPTNTQRLAYEELLRRIGPFVDKLVPDAATMAVISKGDDQLLKATHRTARHFPCGSNGEYTGYHPACSLAAIAMLEVARGQGADFLLVPQ